MRSASEAFAPRLTRVLAVVSTLRRRQVGVPCLRALFISIRHTRLCMVAIFLSIGDCVCWLSCQHSTPPRKTCATDTALRFEAPTRSSASTAATAVRSCSLTRHVDRQRGGEVRIQRRGSAAFPEPRLRIIRMRIRVCGQAIADRLMRICVCGWPNSDPTLPGSTIPHHQMRIDSRGLHFCETTFPDLASAIQILELSSSRQRSLRDPQLSIRI